MFRALSSFLGQRYNIFHRNPNRVNISQHAPNVNLQRFAADGGWDVVYYEAGFGRERPTVSSVAARPGFNGNFVPKTKGVT